METSQVLLTRRSIKSYLDKPIEKETILKLLDLARHSPSGANKNPWHFVVTTDKDQIAKLGEAHRACVWLGKAAAAIVVVADPAQSRYWLEDSCVAAFSICLAAADMNLGAAWAAMYQSDAPEESQRRQQYVRGLFGIPENLAVPMVLGFGYTDKQPAERKKAEVADVTSWEKYTAPSPKPV